MNGPLDGTRQNILRTSNKCKVDMWRGFDCASGAVSSRAKRCRVDLAIVGSVGRRVRAPIIDDRIQHGDAAERGQYARYRALTDQGMPQLLGRGAEA
jgi:hypothetical protein